MSDIVSLSPEAIEEIRQALVLKESSLKRNIASELEDLSGGSEGHHLADMDDLSGDANDEETAFKILAIESAELGQIEQALARISAGTYGLCATCDKPINLERLNALPFAGQCIACRRLEESEGY